MSQQSFSDYEPYSDLESEQKQGIQSNVNMKLEERNLSMVGGSLLLGFALIRRGWVGLGVGALGASLLYQGTTGSSPLYNLLKLNRAVHNTDAPISVPHEQGKHITSVVTINRPTSELYTFWRDFTHLPQFMSHLNSVTVQDRNGTRSRWSVKGPVGMNIEYDAEIINEQPFDVIAWRSLENPYINHAGAVRFKPAPAGQGTEVRVEMEYLPIGGAAGAAVAAIMGQSPEQQIHDSLREFKRLMEAGDLSTPPLTDKVPAE
jgi:uncharacterized membrane protein